MKSKPRAGILAVQSFLEEVAFKNSMECGYVRNPFTNKQHKASTTEDVLQHVYHDKLPFSGAAGTILVKGASICHNALVSFVLCASFRYGDQCSIFNRQLKSTVNNYFFPLRNPPDKETLRNGVDVHFKSDMTPPVPIIGCLKRTST